MSDTSPKNGWNEYAKLVINSLDANEIQHKEITDTLNKLVIKLAVLETKMTIRAGLSGAIAAAVPVIIGLVIWFITKA